MLETLMMKLWEVSHGKRLTDYLLADGLLTTMLSLLLQRAGTVELNQKNLALTHPIKASI
ncbi:hypothetical protein [Sinorhizobium medicae]|uniref:hypothetical protein n=1 Tax=Sinorhizobium medicae TaxID=110321 RepID=UPI00308E6321|nr:hypothetical protein U8C38_28365 [Sinorhizobium medicae]